MDDYGSRPISPRRGRQITDARGRKIKPLDPVAMHLLRRHDMIDADVLGAIAGEPGVKITVQERASLIGGVAVLLLTCGLFFYSMFVGDLGEAPYAKTSSVLLFTVMVWIAWWRIRRARFDKVAAAMLRHRRCPHCGYDLSNLDPGDRDGATLCPECGCAWPIPT